MPKGVRNITEDEKSGMIVNDKLALMQDYFNLLEEEIVKHPITGQPIKRKKLPSDMIALLEGKDGKEVGVSSQFEVDEQEVEVVFATKVYDQKQLEETVEAYKKEKEGVIEHYDNDIKDMEDILKEKVYLDIWVKVLRDWRKRPRILKALGYDEG